MTINIEILIIVCAVIFFLGIFIGRIVTNNITSGEVTMVRRDAPFKSEKRNPGNTKKQKNLLEIKLKETDGVPEIWYKGEQLNPFGIVEVEYRFITKDTPTGGVQDIKLKGYDFEQTDRNHTKKTVSLDVIESHRLIFGEESDNY
ncbi:hypothetical protein [Carnobacterium divergens]|uniref:hypothetical protein n=1 Tax=Carnobacterium divergens TaxID=2748 RepID=UPI001072CF3A|nr:hypothetical protein [Carnobacterium divergens]TFI75538.1 hypothetical protein CKN81_01495 [Carnobacterium divergens]